MKILIEKKRLEAENRKEILDEYYIRDGIYPDKNNIKLAYPI